MATTWQQTITDPESVCEQTTCTLTLTLTDENGDTISTSSPLTACTLTLYDKATGTILNSRDAQSINNANGGTVTSGVLTLELSYLDNALHNANRATEAHVALIEYTWAGGTKYGKKEITFTVRNAEQVA